MGVICERMDRDATELIDAVVADWLSGAGLPSTWPSEERCATAVLSGPRKPHQVGRTGRPGAPRQRDASHRHDPMCGCSLLERRAICLAVAGSGSGALSQGQIAAKLGCSVSSAHRAIARARIKIEKNIIRDAKRDPGWGDPDGTA